MGILRRDATAEESSPFVAVIARTRQTDDVPVRVRSPRRHSRLSPVKQGSTITLTWLAGTLREEAGGKCL